MKCIFATVGTTSFDQFVESVCSMPFLTATLQAVNLTTLKPPSAHSVLLLQSTSDQPHPLPSCEIQLSSKFSQFILSSSDFSPPSSFTDPNEGTRNEDSVEIIIQYGKGRCPVHFIPSEIDRTKCCKIDDDQGSISVSLPINKEGATKHYTLHIKWYRFKPSLASDMERADIILCHAGAGTLLEALALSNTSSAKTSTERSRVNSTNQRVINAVINTDLMDNHQSELAEELEKRNHILVTKQVEEWTSLSGAHNFWKELNGFFPKPFLGGCRISQVDQTCDRGVSNFQRIVDRVMGISNY